LTSKPISCIKLSLVQLESLFPQVPNQQREKLEMLIIQSFPNFLSNQTKTTILAFKLSKQNKKFNRKIWILKEIKYIFEFWITRERERERERTCWAKCIEFEWWRQVRGPCYGREGCRGDPGAPPIRPCLQLRTDSDKKILFFSEEIQQKKGEGKVGTCELVWFSQK
jgi:hypothetical protein